MANYQGFYNGAPITFKPGESNNTECDDGTYGRPKDWLPMPELNDDEIFMLLLIPNNRSTLIAFKVVCNGSYNVDIGTVSDGKFVSTKTRETVSSGSTYENEIYADDFNATTSQDLKQVMIKISGTYIREWENVGHSKRPELGAYPIFDFRCKLPKGRKLKLTSEPVSTNYTLTSLRYFSWEGENNLTDAQSMFDCLYSLTAVLALDTSKVTTTNAMFRYCYTLLHVPDFDTSKVTNMEQMFYNCYSLPDCPDMETSLVENMKYMFRWNLRMRRAPKMDYSNVTDLYGTFYGCASLLSLQNFNIQKVTTITDIFKNCNNLSVITLDPNVSDWSGINIDMTYLGMDRKGLVELFNSLPRITTTKNLSIFGNPGTNDLTNSDKSIATNKGWYVVTT